MAEATFIKRHLLGKEVEILLSSGTKLGPGKLVEVWESPTWNSVPAWLRLSSGDFVSLKFIEVIACEEMREVGYESADS